MDFKKVKFVVFVPVTHSDIIRDVLSKVGAGIIGNYDSCSFSSIGTGHFRGNENSNPSIGAKNVLEKVEEERIEVVVDKEKINEVINVVKESHPYEEVVFDVYPLLDF